MFQVSLAAVAKRQKMFGQPVSVPAFLVNAFDYIVTEGMLPCSRDRLVDRLVHLIARSLTHSLPTTRSRLKHEHEQAWQ